MPSSPPRIAARSCDHRGFTLVELLLVVTIIGIVASFAVPNFLRARMAAREGSALNTVRNMISSQSAYSLSKGYGKFAPDLGTLQTAGFIDEVLGAGTKNGYWFSVSGADSTFYITARPTEYGATGVRSFYGDESGVIRFTSADAPPDSTSLPLGSE